MFINQLEYDYQRTQWLAAKAGAVQSTEMDIVASATLHDDGKMAVD